MEGRCPSKPPRQRPGGLWKPGFGGGPKTAKQVRVPEKVPVRRLHLSEKGNYYIFTTPEDGGACMTVVSFSTININFKSSGAKSNGNESHH